MVCSVIGRAVIQTRNTEQNYHWYRQEADGTWSHKTGSTAVITGVEDPIIDVKKMLYNHSWILLYYGGL